MIGYVITAAAVFGLIVFGAGAILAAAWLLEKLLDQIIGRARTFELLIAAGTLLRKEREKVETQRRAMFERERKPWA